MTEVRISVRSSDSPNLSRPNQPQSVVPVHSEQGPSILIDDTPRSTRINSPTPKRVRTEEGHHQVVILQQHSGLTDLQNFGLIHHTLEVG